MYLLTSGRNPKKEEGEKEKEKEEISIII